MLYIKPLGAFGGLEITGVPVVDDHFSAFISESSDFV